jgi:hypothetical protein
MSRVVGNLKKIGMLKMDVKEREYESCDWLHVTHGTYQ